jgi:hypothetical protein
MAKSADREKRIKEWQRIIKEVGTDTLEETLKNAPSLMEASKPLMEASKPILFSVGKRPGASRVAQFGSLFNCTS